MEFKNFIPNLSCLIPATFTTLEIAYSYLEAFCIGEKWTVVFPTKLYQNLFFPPTSNSHLSFIPADCRPPNASDRIMASPLRDAVNPAVTTEVATYSSIPSHQYNTTTYHVSFKPVSTTAPSDGVSEDEFIALMEKRRSKVRAGCRVSNSQLR